MYMYLHCIYTYIHVCHLYYSTEKKLKENGVSILIELPNLNPSSHPSWNVTLHSTCTECMYVCMYVCMVHVSVWSAHEGHELIRLGNFYAP